MAKIYHIVPSTLGSIRCSLQSSIAFLITICVIVVIYFAGENGGLYDQKEELLTNCSTSNCSTDQNHSSESCDLFSGKWVFDNKSYPLYKEEECTFMSDQLACEKFGRKDLDYQHWRWQPHECNLPRSLPLLSLMSLFYTYTLTQTQQKVTNIVLFNDLSINLNYHT